MSRTLRRLLPLLALFAAAAEAPRDWAATLREDARAFHDTVAANHPGPVNRLDPGFATRNDAALALALKRAALVKDYPGYLSALRAYAGSFDDGHVAISMSQAPAVALRWPGFLTAYAPDGRQVVRTRLEDAAVPLGAELIGCDGRPAETLARQIVGDFRGRWMLAATRAQAGFRLFVDNGNPFVRRPERCTFRVAGKRQVVDLAWRPLSDAEWDRHAAPLGQFARPPIAARTLADGTRWFSLSSFDGDPAGETAQALNPLIAGMKRERAALSAAPRLVLDLRGNGGGSSDWSQQIAAILWGQPAIDALKLDAEAVEWRASAANVASLAAYREQFAKAPDASAPVKRYFARAAEGIAAARAAGKPLWREPSGLFEAEAGPKDAAPLAPLRARVLIVTDAGCASACLDAVDLWKALGAVQVGQVTGADTLYMDIRQDPLPSGLGTAVVPMKVYRGRARGSNVPQTPRFTFAGSMADTPALERWVAGLRP